MAEGYRNKPTVIVGEVGLHCPYEVSGSEVAPGTESGIIDTIEGDAQVLFETTTVPAILELGFGVEIMLSEGSDLTGAQIVVRHPPMGESGVTEQRWYPNLSHDDFTLSLYRFDYNYEMLTGPWTISLEQDGQTHFIAEFDVIPAPAGMTLESLCSGEGLVS